MGRRRRVLAALSAAALVFVAPLMGGLLLAGCTKAEEEATTTVSSAAPVTETTVPTLKVAAGDTWQIDGTTVLGSLIVEEGAVITAGEGKSVTLTVDGVETGQKLATSDGYDLVFAAGTYSGDVVLTVTEANPVEYVPAGPDATPTVSPLRQAIYVGADGFSEAKSVIAAVVGRPPEVDIAKDFTITSTGECFNGVYAAGSYTIQDCEIDLTGNARSDFSGYGAAVVGVGAGTTLVIDGAQIRTEGVARAAVIATDGANVIVKNSDLVTKNGVLPADYTPTIDTAQMRSVPWMLSLSGNVRATNLLGIDTKASYINSSITSEGWGVLSTDGCTTPTLTAINSAITITGDDGYGSYGIGDATEYFLGCAVEVPSYATISRGSHLYYGDSEPETVSRLNADLGLGLSEEELAALPNMPTLVESGRFGVMWHGGGTLEVSGGTVFKTKETTFLDKGQAVKITVDGAEGASLEPENGVIVQLMDDDDPGPDTATMLNTGVYREPTDPVMVDATHDLARVGDQDAQAVFSNITLVGDFYNSTRGGVAAAAAPPPGGSPAAAPSPAPGDTVATPGDTEAPTPGDTGAAAPGEPAAPGEGAAAPGGSKNLCLTFDNSNITGIISASTAKHAKATIEAADYKLLGTVTNTPGPAVNNGVIVVLTNHSTWTLPSTCYITSLTLEEGCALKGGDGGTLVMMVDGVETPIVPGTFVGEIELIIS